MNRDKGRFWWQRINQTSIWTETENFTKTKIVTGSEIENLERREEAKFVAKWPNYQSEWLVKEILQWKLHCQLSLFVFAKHSLHTTNYLNFQPESESFGSGLLCIRDEANLHFRNQDLHRRHKSRLPTYTSPYNDRKFQDPTLLPPTGLIADYLQLYKPILLWQPI